MKYKVIGWTTFKNPQYNSFEGKNYEDYCYARLAVIEDIRKNGYAFCGDAHQYAKGCVAVLNNGKAFRCASQREWGALMAEAWDSPNDDGMSYMIWYVDSFRADERPKRQQKSKLPKPFVDKSKILPLETVFETDLPERYAPYMAIDKENLLSFIVPKMIEKLGNKDEHSVIDMTLCNEAFWQIYDGIKTVEVRLNDEKRQQLKISDGIIFFLKDHAEHYISVQVTGLRRFPSFQELFSADLLFKTGFDGYSVKDAAEKMYDFYDREQEEKYGVLAIEFQVLKK